MEKMVRLGNFTGPYQCSLVEEILKKAGILVTNQRASGIAIALGVENPDAQLGGQDFLVPQDRLQEAKDLLCANGVLCEISERLLRRCMSEIVAPLLGSPGQDRGRLIRFIAINNKETVRALFKATLGEEGGKDLLVELFFTFAEEGAPGLRNLARGLRASMDDDFGERFFEKFGAAVAKTTRLNLLDIIPELPVSSWRVEFLAAAMRDPDAEVRDAGSEALFALGGFDYGYDPDAGSLERETSVQRMLKDSGFY